MTFEKKLAKIFNLNDKNWLKHANPWSVWTRYSVLPLIALAFWSRIWIGNWAYVAGALSIAWIFINPIVFKAPKSTKNWASKAVMGERIYLQRDKVKLPIIHRTPLYSLLNFISSCGMVTTIWGISYYHIWAVVLGIALAYLGKSWFLDRMVWLFEDMKNSSSEFKRWEY